MYWSAISETEMEPIFTFCCVTSDSSSSNGPSNDSILTRYDIPAPYIANPNRACPSANAVWFRYTLMGLTCAT